MSKPVKEEIEKLEEYIKLLEDAKRYDAAAVAVGILGELKLKIAEITFRLNSEMAAKE